MHVDGDTAAIVLDGYGVVFIDKNFDVCTIACQRFIDGVIHHFVDQMVQAFLAYVANIHRGALTHGFKTLKHLNVVRR